MQVKRKGCRVLCAALRALLRTVHSEATYAVPPTCGDVVEPSRVPTLPRRSKISELRPRITLGHMLGHFFWMRLCVLFMAALALALSMRGGKHSHQYRLPNSGAPPSNRSASAAVLRYRYNRRPRVNAVASAFPRMALFMLSALATTVITQPAPPPPPRPESEELDGRHRFPSRSNSTVQALLAPQCIPVGNLLGQVGCVGVRSPGRAKLTG